MLNEIQNIKARYKDCPKVSFNKFIKEPESLPNLEPKPEIQTWFLYFTFSEVGMYNCFIDGTLIDELIALITITRKKSTFKYGKNINIEISNINTIGTSIRAFSRPNLV